MAILQYRKATIHNRKKIKKEDLIIYTMISELSQNAKLTKLQFNFIRYEVLSTIVRMVTKLIDH